MSNEQRIEANSPGAGPGADDEGPPQTPFDSPYFLPILVWGFTLYFGYDAWIANHEYVKFNRFGFGIGLAASIYYTATTLRRLPYALCATWAALALWFGYMGFLADGWWNDGEEAMVGDYFAKGTFVFSVLASAISGLRATLRLRRERAAGGGAGDAAS
jgi:hypothetical protein